MATKHQVKLVLRAQAGDLQAFDQLLGSIQERLYRYICSLVGQRQLAEDILQEVFFKIYRKLAWLEEAELFSAWVYRIATRESFRHIKQERKMISEEETMLDNIPAATIESIFSPELINEIPTMLQSLSPASRAVLVLHYLHEMTLEEVAEILGIATGTVKSRLAYGLSCLRERWKDLPHH